MPPYLDFGPPKDRRRLPNPIRARGRTPGERFLRSILLIAVFVGVAVLFNRHFERSMERIEAGKAVSDQTGRMTADDKRFARDFGRALKERYGFDFRLRAGPGAAAPPADLTPRSLYVGLDQNSGEATLLLPPLLGRAIGDDFGRELADRLRAASTTETWPETLDSVLTDLWLRLKQVEAEEAGREHGRSSDAGVPADGPPERPTDEPKAGASGLPTAGPGDAPAQGGAADAPQGPSVGQSDESQNHAGDRDAGEASPSPEAKPESGAFVERTGQDDPGQADLPSQENGRQDDLENRR